MVIEFQKYIKENYWSVLNEYVVIRSDSIFYNKKTKNKIYQIKNWNSEEYFLEDAYTKEIFGWVKWGDTRKLNEKELKKLEIIKNTSKYNL